METIFHVLGVALFVIYAVLVIWDPRPAGWGWISGWVRLRWLSLLGFTAGLAIMCWTIQLDQPVVDSTAWTTTFNGGTWWSWLLIAGSVAVMSFGAFRPDEITGTNRFTGDDVRLAFGGALLAVIFWVPQGNLQINCGDTILCPVRGTVAAGQTTEAYVAAAKNGAHPDVDTERIFTRPALGDEESDSARLIWTGWGRWIVVGVDSQPAANAARLPHWASKRFNAANNPSLLSAASGGWLRRMVQLDINPAPESIGIDVPPATPSAPAADPVMEKLDGISDQITAQEEHLKNLDEKVQDMDERLAHAEEGVRQFIEIGKNGCG
ncbi:MAG: hypothetical protein PHR51_01595 [Patescibacteria group bacterium]|nr:hypothetical protein [Patescibacteria group bacterium]